MNTKKILLSTLPFVLASCSGGGSSNSSSSGRDPSKATEITIYAGGSSEYMWKKGGMEAEAYRAIEDAYYEATGNNIKFKTEFLGQKMKETITTGINDGEIDVVISHLGGGDGIDDWMMNQNTKLYRDLSLDLEDYEYLGSNMAWSDGGSLSLNALDRVTTKAGEVIAFPSVINPYKFGILVRKDWMKACGYSDVEEAGYTLVDNYEDFEAMCLAMKARYGLTYTLSGAIYEIEKTGILGAYDIPAGYYTQSEDTYNGQKIVDVGGLINSNYGKVLNVESRWISNGILPQAPDEKKVDDCEADFIAGKTGVFLENPNITHLVEVSRLCKAVNPGAEFAVLQAMTKDKSSTSKGFMRNSVATFGAVITKNTPDYKAILSFLNWAYSSKENYELCRYGIKGTHWIDNKDGTYSYPDGYDYQNKPYSGILTLVENQVISNLSYSGFTDTEKSWFTNAAKKENYLVNDKVDYLLILQNKDALNVHFANRKAMYTFTQNIWSGVYSYDSDHVHGSDGGAATCKTYNTADRQAEVDAYLASTAKKYSEEVYKLYEALKRNSRVK